MPSNDFGERRQAERALELMPSVVYHGPGDAGLDSRSCPVVRAEADTVRPVVAGQVGLDWRPCPVLRDPFDVLIRVRATGICGTDRAIAVGEFPARPGVILGHETVGEVHATGPAVRGLRPGDRVVVNPTYACGQCGPCLRGLGAHCAGKTGREIGVDCDGTMTSFTVCDARFVRAVPPGLSHRRTVLIEPLACVLTNVDAASARWDDRVLVAGAGPIGMLTALVLAMRGSRVAVAEHDPERVALAASVLPPSVQVVAVPTGRLTAATAAGAPRPDIVIDTTGTLLSDAVRVVARGGTVVIMGEKEDATATVAVRPIVTRGIRVVGAGPYPPHRFDTAVDLATDLPMECLVTHELPVAKADDALALLGVGPPGAATGYRAGKVLLIPDGWEPG